VLEMATKGINSLILKEFTIICKLKKSWNVNKVGKEEPNSKDWKVNVSSASNEGHSRYHETSKNPC
jgi:hypothetical protein